MLRRFAEVGFTLIYLIFRWQIHPCGNGAFSRQREARVAESLELAVESFDT